MNTHFIIRFEDWCPRCVHRDLSPQDEKDRTCMYCMAHCGDRFTSKPINFEERKDIKTYESAED